MHVLLIYTCRFIYFFVFEFSSVKPVSAETKGFPDNNIKSNNYEKAKENLTIIIYLITRKYYCKSTGVLLSIPVNTHDCCIIF